jgi:hypothetical protein
LEEKTPRSAVAQKDVLTVVNLQFD